MLTQVLLTGVAAAALTVAGTAARAGPTGNITTNTWYTGHFTSVVPSALLAGPLNPSSLGTNGPILPNISKQPTALPAPGTAGGVLSATITLPHGGYVLVTDVEASGDRFEMFVNGVPAGPSSNQLIPPGQPAVGSFTSVTTGGHGVGENITAALSDPFFSSGTFLLPPGTDTITGNYVGVVGFGDMNLIVEAPVPEPASLALLGAGLLGLGAVRRRSRPG